MYIYPYRTGSRSVTSMRRTVPLRYIRREGSRFIGAADKTVINWGCSEIPEQVARCSIINTPEQVAIVSNKLTFFSHMQGYEYLPEFTTDRQECLAWLTRGCIVVCRTVLNGHSGNGIVLAREPGEIVDAPLYTLYKKKRREFRVHQFRQAGRLVQEKGRRLDTPDDEVNWQIRNHDNGFIYKLGVEGEYPAIITQIAEEVIDRCGLDFGAVDIIYNDNDRRGYVLEVNTAPGIEGRTLEFYTQQFRRIMENG